MNSSWMDELWKERAELDDGGLGSFYCPYTNDSVCALLTKGWQPQELCQDLACDQLKYIRPRPRRHRRAA